MLHKSEAQYQAEADAQTLISAEQIKSEPSRMKKARLAARKVATDAAKAAKTAKKVASPRKAMGKRRR